MAGPTNTLIVEGSFEELADELAVYLDNLATSAGQSPSLQSDLQPLLQEGKKEDALKKLVTASPILSNAPEREYIAAYNQLIQLVRQAPKPDMFLPRICQAIAQPVSSSAHNSVGLQLNILTTIFNTLPSDSESRYHVLLAILTVIRKQSTTFEILRPQLKTLDLWLQNWEVEKEDQRKLYLAIHDLASDAGDAAASYSYLLKALRTIQDADDASSKEAQQLSLKAISMALTNPSTYDFSDLASLDSVQALRRSEPEWFELLEIFSTENLEDYRSFTSEHKSWVDSHSSALEPSSVLETKMRLLTLSSLAASASQTRSLPYATIAEALQIEKSDVERWVIDVIRAGLVEGKLSQSSQTFLIHRATYRRFGEHQWREVAARLDMWKRSLEGVLRVLAEQRKEYQLEKDGETRGENNAGSGGFGMGQGRQQGYNRGGGYQRRQQQQSQQAVEVE